MRRADRLLPAKRAANEKCRCALLRLCVHLSEEDNCVELHSSYTLTKTLVGLNSRRPASRRGENKASARGCVCVRESAIKAPPACAPIQICLLSRAAGETVSAAPLKEKSVGREQSTWLRRKSSISSRRGALFYSPVARAVFATMLQSLKWTLVAAALLSLVCSCCYCDDGCKRTRARVGQDSHRTATKVSSLQDCEKELDMLIRFAD